MTIVQTSDTIIFVESRLHGQAVKTPPFHGGNRGSNPLGVTKIIENKTGDSNPRSTSLGVIKLIETPRIFFGVFGVFCYLEIKTKCLVHD